VLYGDFVLHAEPGAPFFPTDEQETKALYMKEIPLAKPVTIRAMKQHSTVLSYEQLL
jgi:hypothetical protein